MFYFRCIFYTFYTNTGKMITDRIKALFNFIDFLHSNIEDFMQYDEVVNELHLLAEQHNNYGAKSNFKEKLKYDEVQAKIAQKYDIIDKNIIQIIKSKVVEFDICDWNETNTLWNNNIKEINNLKENFSEDDIQIIISYKNKYLEYRTVIKDKVFFGTDFFFSHLDQILKVLFDFFKESTINEFEAFEKKTIIVSSISRTVELFKKGYGDCKFEINVNYCLPDLSNGIFDLTLQNLVDCGLSKKHTSELLKNKGKYILQCNEGNFFVSGEERKVYTGIEFYRKTCFDNGKIQFPFNCPDLIPEYFDLAFNEFKEEQIKFLGKIYNDRDAFFEFIKNEVDKMQKRIDSQNEYLLKHRYHKFESKENDIKVCEAYIQYLNRKIDEVKQPQQLETNNTDEVKIIDNLKQNKFDDVQPSKVYQHFKQLVENKYITNENFNLFLSTVFEQNKTLTTKIEIIKPNSKQRVQKIFYTYYETFVQNKYGTKQTYIDLLCNNFTGFNSKNLLTNFAK